MLSSVSIICLVSCPCWGKRCHQCLGQNQGPLFGLCPLDSCVYDDLGFVSVVLPAYCIYCLHTNTEMMNMFAGGKGNFQCFLR